MPADRAACIGERLSACGHLGLDGHQADAAPEHVRGDPALRHHRLTDPGLALFCGLNTIPKKSYLCEYSSRLDHARTTSLLAAWHLLAAPA